MSYINYTIKNKQKEVFREDIQLGVLCFKQIKVQKLWFPALEMLLQGVNGTLATSPQILTYITGLAKKQIKLCASGMRHCLIMALYQYFCCVLLQAEISVLCIDVIPFQYFHGTLFSYKHIDLCNNFSILLRTRENKRLKVDLYWNINSQY